MSILFAYPKNASFGRMVSKEAIYRHSALSGKVKELFVRRIERITRQYKLAPETINIPATPAVPEIQVFGVQLRQEECAPEILAAIDRAVQFPLLFELCYQDRVRGVAAWKRLGESAAGATLDKWVLSIHYSGPWLAQDAPRSPLPHVLNLEGLYAALLRPLLPYPAKPNESLAEQIARIEAIGSVQYEIAQCEAKLYREKRFNRKIGINRELRQLRQKFLVLTNLPV
ncbi:MAG: DUF4391 domain-containing protein [Deltaproteobacteria bacterium]|jgi:hypothetical protein|nr:DUF4391 domain-containing protein [Deltaproteobacteria bacterium]